MKHIIVGVDPGKSAAIACLDLEGNPIHIDYSRFVGFDWFVDKIKNVGTPVIIASDKKNSTHTINKLAAAFGAHVFMPDQDISVKRKEEVAAGKKIGNLHERDALVAAITAYNAYAHKFKQAEKLARQTKYENVDKLKAMIVKKYSIYDTINNKKAGSRA
ncbi:MAG: DUF460 domain-containing protein [Candidatus Micrarchaeales archaeon]